MRIRVEYLFIDINEQLMFFLRSSVFCVDPEISFMIYYNFGCM